MLVLEDGLYRGDERSDVFARERDGVAPVTVVELGGFLDRVESLFVPVVSSDANRSGRFGVRHVREHDPLYLVFRFTRAGLDYKEGIGRDVIGARTKAITWAMGRI